jgi:epsilon-lactone hydrolase
MQTRRVTAPWKTWLSVTAYGIVTRLYGANTPPIAMRRRFERLAAVTRDSLKAKYPNVVFSDHQAGKLWIESVRAMPSPRRFVLYLHGGGYLFGSPAGYRDRARQLSYRCKAEVFVPDYRLAPEHPYPAALEDALAAWMHVSVLRPDGPIIVAGDSAGGGLALSLLAALRDRGETMPAGAFVFSPWTDLAGTGSSVTSNQGSDVWLSRRHIEVWGRHYAGKSNVADPGISPVHADPTGFPPLLMIVGDREVLFDDTLRVEAKARNAGVDVEVCVGRGMQHDFPLALPWLEESREAWEAVVAFLDRCAGSTATSQPNSAPYGNAREAGHFDQPSESLASGRER